MATTNTWNQIVSKITGVVNRGTLNWSGSNTTYVLSSGYYIGGTLDSRPSYTNGYNTGVSAADNRVNTSSASYSSGYNNGYNAGVSNGQSSRNLAQRLNSVGRKTPDNYQLSYSLGANTGSQYAITTMVYRGNTTANSLKHTLTASQGSVTNLYEKSTTSYCLHVWLYSKSNSGAAATIYVTANRSTADVDIIAVGG